MACVDCSQYNRSEGSMTVNFERYINQPIYNCVAAFSRFLVDEKVDET